MIVFDEQIEADLMRRTPANMPTTFSKDAEFQLVPVKKRRGSPSPRYSSNGPFVGY